MRPCLLVLFVALNVGGQSSAITARAPSQMKAGSQIYTPGKGSPERKAILDAVRARPKTKTNSRWIT